MHQKPRKRYLHLQNSVDVKKSQLQTSNKRRFFFSQPSPQHTFVRNKGLKAGPYQETNDF